MLTILRSPVLPHKHPHELLDSVVKERFDQAFRLNRGRAFYSSLSTCQALFRKFSFLLNRLPPRRSLNLLKREANHTASISAVNRLFTASPELRTRHRQRFNLTLPARRILLKCHRPCNPFRLPNLLIYQDFPSKCAAKVVRIIGGFRRASTGFYIKLGKRNVRPPLSL